MAASPVKINIRVLGLPEIQSRLKRQRLLIKSGHVEGLSKIARRVLARVKELTPRDTGATRRLWKLAEFKPTAKGREAYLAVITHRFNVEGALHPKTGKPVNTGRFNLIDALEYGTRPHKIRPKNGRYLVFSVVGSWRSSLKTGRQTTTRRLIFYPGTVDHPGTRAYGMLRIAGVEADRDVAALQAKLLAEIEADLAVLGRVGGK